MKTCLIAIVGLLALPLSALAQEVGETRPAIDELTLGVRIPFLGGDLDNTGSSKKWNDLYGDAGGGFEAKYSHLFKVSPVVAVGPYAGFTVDVFGGNHIDVDPGSGLQRWDVDPWAVTRLVFGARVREQWGAFFMDENIGLGPVFYAAGNASDPRGFNDIEIIKGSVDLTFELGLRLGAVVSRKVDLGLGLAWELNGAPDTGRDLSSTIDFKAQTNFVLTFLINLNF